MLVQLGSTTDVQQKVELLLLFAEVSEKKLADTQGRLRLHAAGHRAVAPGNSTAHFEALRLARFVKGQQELASQLIEVSPQVESAALATSMLRDAAELAEEARAIDDAVVAYTTALGRSPNNLELLKALSALLERHRRDAERELVLRQLCEVVDASEREQAYRTLAELQESLGRHGAAAESWQKALDAGGAADELFDRKAQALERAGKGGGPGRGARQAGAALEAKGDAEAAANVKACWRRWRRRRRASRPRRSRATRRPWRRIPSDAAALAGARERARRPPAQAPRGARARDGERGEPGRPPAGRGADGGGRRLAGHRRADRGAEDPGRAAGRGPPAAGAGLRRLRARGGAGALRRGRAQARAHRGRAGRRARQLRRGAGGVVAPGGRVDQARSTRSSRRSTRRTSSITSRR